MWVCICIYKHREREIIELYSVCICVYMCVYACIQCIQCIYIYCIFAICRSIVPICLFMSMAGKGSKKPARVFVDLLQLEKNLGGLLVFLELLGCTVRRLR